MKSLKEIESVGWGFFGLCFVLVLAPSIWLVWNYTYDNVAPAVRVLAGFVVASTCAGVIAWVVNDLLHRRNVRRYEAQRQEARKEKRKQTQGKKGKNKK